MTERFSPAYIAFILSDEAKVLQGHLPREGEGVWFIQRWLVEVGPSDWSEPHVLGEDDTSYILDYEDYEDLEYVVLPTLTDLLGMIEEAGWRVGLDDTDVGYSFCSYKVSKSVGPIVFSQEGERLLAAAKLAVRVLEGR